MTQTPKANVLVDRDIQCRADGKPMKPKLNTTISTTKTYTNSCCLPQNHIWDTSQMRCLICGKMRIIK
jgi:hypothetical protein